MVIDKYKYYLVDVSYTYGKIVEAPEEKECYIGQKSAATRHLFNYSEMEFKTMREAKKHLERNGYTLLHERKLAPYTVETTGNIMQGSRVRSGYRNNEEYTITVNSEKTGWTVIDGFDLLRYFKEYGLNDQLEFKSLYK